MSQIVGIFQRPSEAEAAHALIADAGYREPRLVLLRPVDAREPLVRFCHRGELMLRSALRWAIYGSLMIEVPGLLLLFLLPVDTTVKVFMGATIWKFGAAFGAWLGGALASERGVDEETADEYESYLAEGLYIIAADVQSKDRPFVRGAMIESGAGYARNIEGSFIMRTPRSPTTVGSAL